MLPPNFTEADREWLAKAIESQKTINREYARRMDKDIWDAVLTLRANGMGLMEALQTVNDALNRPQSASIT